MSHLLEAFEIEFPPGVDGTVIASVQQAVASLEGVDQCGQSSARSIDPAMLTVWVTLAGTMITTFAAAVPIIKQVIDMLKSKGIKGAKLVLANGGVLQLDEIRVEDLLKLTQNL